MIETEPVPKYHLSVVANPNDPPHEVAAVAAFNAELDDLLARLATHPKEQWVAYRGSERVGIGSDHLAFLKECSAKFPDGMYNVFHIDPMLRCTTCDTEV